MTDERSPWDKHNFTGKQEAFIRRYLSNGFNGVEAAGFAGYQGSYATLGSVGSENLKKPKIAEVIEWEMDRMVMSPDEALAELSVAARGEAQLYLDRNGYLDMDMLRETGLVRFLRDLEITTTRHGLKYKGRFMDRQKALETILKVHKRIQPDTVVNVMGFDEALEKIYGDKPEEEEDAAK